MANKDGDAEQKTEILDWIGAVVGEPIERKEPFEKVLKDGVILCKLINKMVPGHVKKINTKGGNFALMENLAAFQKGMRAYGVPEDELFQPVDLFEARNVKAVVRSLAALARIALNKGFAGPAFGPKMSEENKREFSEDLLRQGRDGHIGLQAGYNKGATQAGINMGKPRCALNKGFAGPAFGPKMSDENKREFSEDLLRQGRQGHIGLQAGSNKGATQAGINMGKPRSIND